MNCVKVQEAIWCGELTLEMRQHIATCEDCQHEQRDIQNLSNSMEHVQIPVQSRSMLPAKREIEQTLRARKRKAFTKWGISGVAAVACVWAAVMVVPSFLHGPSGTTDATASIDPKQSPIDRPQTADIRFGSTSSAEPSNQKEPSSATTSSSTTTSPKSVASATPPTADQPYVTVDAGMDVKYVQQANEIKNALTRTFDPTMFKHITIQKLQQDVQNSNGENLSFVVTLFVQHQPGQGSAYGNGDIVTTRFAHFTNQRGIWNYDGLATSPVFLPSTSGDWHEVFVKNSANPLATFKIPPFLEAQNNADGSVTLTNQGKQMGMLEIEMQAPHNSGDYSKPVSLPNGTQVVDQQTLSNGAIHIVQYTLKYDAPDGSGGQATTGTRVYFMRDDKVAYDLSFPEGAISADNLKQIINSFSIAP